MKKKAKPKKQRRHRKPNKRKEIIVGLGYGRFETFNWGTDSRSASLRRALQDLLAFYDKVSGVAPEAIRGVGWSWPDMKRLQEIRKLVASD